ncbi:MAG: DUF1761 domain-containing protein [Saprospiraceae bacterium]
MAYLEPIIGAIAAFLLGFGWYTFAFGKVWQAETGLSDEDANKDMARTHGLAFLMMVVLSYAVNMFINYHDVAEQTFTHGGFHGAQLALMYCVPAVAINYLYQRKSLKLFLIDAAYIVAFMALSGAVMAALKLS